MSVSVDYPHAQPGLQVDFSPSQPLLQPEAQKLNPSQPHSLGHPELQLPGQSVM